ncbi:Uroporphyrinogen decarboxylase [Phlebopus sp. FC_14]|nr:Uroporphyrinogen decarboxylase [Phlebopus sp. FC_14]
MSYEFPSGDFPPLKNDLILRAARGEETERAPIWVMRQAGRYLPTYKQIRDEKETFFDLCEDPDTASRITLLPIEYYNKNGKHLIDAAIIFSDILVIPRAMGMEVHIYLDPLPNPLPPGVTKPGPHFPSPLKEPEDMSKLKESVDVKDSVLKHVFESLTVTRKKLGGQVPLIGFCGAPWTLMAYMIEGGASQTHRLSKLWLLLHPTESEQLLDRIADVCVDFLVGQVKAGAQLLQVFDSDAGALSPTDFETFSLPRLTRIAKEVRRRLAEELNISSQAIPIILFAKGASPKLAARAGYDVVSLDWSVDLRDHTAIPDNCFLQGNLDPSVLRGEKGIIRERTRKMCENFLKLRRGPGGGPRGWIANLGHGITPDVKPDHLQVFFESVHEFSASSSKGA